MQPLLDRIERGEIDPSFVITHRLPLDDAPQGYQMFRDKQGRVHQGGAQAARRDGALRMRGEVEWRGRLTGFTPDFRHSAIQPFSVQCGSSLFSVAARSVSVVSFDGARSDRLCQPLRAAVAGLAGRLRQQHAVGEIHRERDAFRHHGVRDHGELRRPRDHQLRVAVAAGVDDLRRGAARRRSTRPAASRRSRTTRTRRDGVP